MLLTVYYQLLFVFCCTSFAPFFWFSVTRQYPNCYLLTWSPQSTLIVLGWMEYRKFYYFMDYSFLSLVETVCVPYIYTQ